MRSPGQIVPRPIARRPHTPGPPTAATAAVAPASSALDPERHPAVNGLAVTLGRHDPEPRQPQNPRTIPLRSHRSSLVVCTSREDGTGWSGVRGIALRTRPPSRPPQERGPRRRPGPQRKCVYSNRRRAPFSWRPIREGAGRCSTMSLSSTTRGRLSSTRVRSRRRCKLKPRHSPRGSMWRAGQSTGSSGRAAEGLERRCDWGRGRCRFLAERSFRRFGGRRRCLWTWRLSRRRHATLPQSWIQRENWEFETHRSRRIIRTGRAGTLRPGAAGDGRGVAGSGRSRWRDPSSAAGHPAGRSGGVSGQRSPPRTTTPSHRRVERGPDYRPASSPRGTSSYTWYGPSTSFP